LRRSTDGSASLFASRLAIAATTQRNWSNLVGTCRSLTLARSAARPRRMPGRARRSEHHQRGGADDGTECRSPNNSAPQPKRMDDQIVELGEQAGAADDREERHVKPPLIPAAASVHALGRGA
jgi:hypothetical protein